MAEQKPLKPGRISSSLMPAANDTGRTAFCGPYVLSAITGYPISAMEAALCAARGVTAEPRSSGEAPIEGTTADELVLVLEKFGYRMTLIESFMERPRKEKPTLWTWMQKPRNAWAYYILVVHLRKETHWVLIKGVKLCDTFTNGTWTFVCEGPHRSARIGEVYLVARAWATPAPERPLPERPVP